MTSPTHVPCPTCGKKTAYTADNTFRPFCGERCKLIDLGAWADETHRIPGEETKQDAGDGTKEDGEE